MPPHPASLLVGTQSTVLSYRGADVLDGALPCSWGSALGALRGIVVLRSRRALRCLAAYCRISVNAARTCSFWRPSDVLSYCGADVLYGALHPEGRRAGSDAFRGAMLLLVCFLACTSAGAELAHWVWGAGRRAHSSPCAGACW